MKKMLALLLAVIMMLPATLITSALPIFIGENDGSASEIYDGVYFTKLALAKTSKYGLQKVNIVEFDLADKTLDLEILKRDSIAGKNNLTTYVTDYNAANENSDVVAAINGDLWMTQVHSNTNVTTQVLTVPRGVLVNDGIVYCSSQIENECTYTTNGEGFGYFWAFGITKDYQPMIGQPVVSLDVRNTSKEIVTTTTALNRLPAHDTLVVYTSDLTNNYALADAYEIELTDIEGEFRFDTTVKGTVSAMYPAESETKATLGEGKVVLTARGAAIENVKDYVIGDKIEIDISVSDVSGRKNNWADSKLVIGGHGPAVLDGVSAGLVGSDAYPSTIIGWKNDGKLFFLQNDGRNAMWSAGFKFSDQADFLLQMGVNSCINVDGGGSSTMVVGDELVNRPSDGAIRSVINGVALVTTTERAEQGSFEPVIPLRFDASYLRFDNEGAVNVVGSGYQNATEASLVDNNLRLSVPYDTNDPYIYYSLAGGVETLRADEYKYIVMKYKTGTNVTTPEMEIFLCAGSVTGATGGKSTRFHHASEAGVWATQIVDLSEIDYWNGDIYGIRLDYFAGNANAGEYMDIEYIALAKTQEEAEAIANGTATPPVVPEEDNSIGVIDGCDYVIEGNTLSNVPYGTSVYKFIKNLNGPKLEVRNADGDVVRNAKVETGFTVCSYNMKLEKADELTIIVNERDPNYSEEESSEEESDDLPEVVPNEGNILFRKSYTISANTSAISDDGIMATDGRYRGDGYVQWNGDLKNDYHTLEWMGTGKTITYTFEFDEATDIRKIVFKGVRVASNRAFGTVFINDTIYYVSSDLEKTAIDGAPLYGDTNSDQFFDIHIPVEINGTNTLSIMIITDMYCCQYDEIEAYGEEGGSSDDSSEENVESSEEIIESSEVIIESSEEIVESSEAEESYESAESSGFEESSEADESSESEESFDDESSDETADVIYGDVNGDETINSLDAAQVLKHDAQLASLSDEALVIADVNGDGSVNSLDAAQILKFDAQLIVDFPVQNT